MDAKINTLLDEIESSLGHFPIDEDGNRDLNYMHYIDTDDDAIRHAVAEIRTELKGKGWIPIEQELPPENQEVWLKFSGFGSCVGYRRHRNGQDVWENMELSGLLPTHWKPYNQPPGHIKTGD